MTNTTPEHQDSLRQHVLCASVVFFTVLTLFTPCFQFSFINLDDDIYVYRNSHVVSGLTLDNIYWAFTSSHGGHWHPITWLSHMLDCELFGLNPGAHHGVNVFFHAATSVLVYLLLVRIFNNCSWSLLLTLIFACHPMRIESVAWVAERKDVLSMFFALLCIHSYLQYAESKCIRYYTLLLILFAMGLLTKPMLVSLPLLFLCIDVWPGRYLVLGEGPLINNGNLRRCLAEKVPLFLLSGMICLVVIYTQQHDGALKNLSSIPLEDRIANVFVSYLSYAGKFFWPTPVAIFYPFQYFSPGVAAGSLLGLLACSILCFQKPSRPSLKFAWFWFIVTLLPVIGLVYVGGQSFADRWSYLPHLGLIIGIGSWLYQFMAHHRKLLYSCTGLFTLFCIGLTAYQLPYWKNSETLFTHTLEVTSDNFLAHTNLGVALSRQGHQNEAAYHYREAARIKPYYPKAINHLGLIEASERNYDAAIELFSEALRRDPSLQSAHFNLGLAYQRKGHILSALSIWLSETGNVPQTKDHMGKFILTVLKKPCPVIRLNIKDWDMLPAFHSALKTFGPQLLTDTENQTALEAASCLLSSPRARKMP